MKEKEYEDESPDDIMQSVARFEQMVKNNSPLFFDQQTFEELIEYFELNNNLPKALEVCDYAIDIYPFSSVFMIKKASVLMQHRKYAEATQWLDKAEITDPSDMGIYLLRSDIFLQKAEHQKAVEVIHKAFEIAGEEEKSELCLEMADVYEDWGKYDKVFEYLRRAITANPENDEALSRMWYSVELSRSYEESIDFHQKLIDEVPYSYLAWQNLGYAYFGLSMYEKAIECYEFTIAINETYDLAYRDVGEAYYMLKQYHRAIEFFQKAIHYSKASEDLYFCLGECYEKMKDFSRARQYYRKALVLQPYFHAAYYRIGVTYKKEKMWQNALHFFRKALKQNPERIQYLMGIAQSSYYLNDETTLVDICNKVLELGVRHRSRKTYEQLITFLIRLHCMDQAEVLIDQAMIERGEHPSLLLMKSICLFSVGKRKEAKQYLELGLTLSKEKHQLVVKLMPQLLFDKEVSEIIDIYR